MTSKGLIVAQVVSRTAIDQSQAPVSIALFAADGTPYPLITKMPNQVAFAGADVTALKVELNALRTKLINAGLMAAS